MNVTCCVDQDEGVKVVSWDANLDDSLEEREEIAERIFNAFIEDGEINLSKLSVTLTHTVYNSYQYNRGLDEYLSDEEELLFSFEISPINYMDLVIPMILDEVDNDWGIEEMASLLYLERDLIDAGYTGKELAQLTKKVNPFREEWLRDE